MCGRFNLTNPADIERRFGFFDWHEKRIEPRFNIAPSQDILTLARVPGAAVPRAQLARWGFAPGVARDRRPPPINARAETLATSGLFRDALRAGRCLIPATGFYEWRVQAGTAVRVPMHISLRSGELFAFAGLWTPGGRDGRPSATIVTCAANELTVTIHDRMPVILRRDDEARWLDPDVSPLEALSVLRPYPAAEMKAYPVSTQVNSFQHEGPQLIARAELPIPQLRLFD